MIDLDAIRERWFRWGRETDGHGIDSVLADAVRDVLALADAVEGARDLVELVGDYRAAVAAERAAHDATPVGVMSADEFEKLKALIRRRVEIHERLLEVAT